MLPSSPFMFLVLHGSANSSKTSSYTQRLQEYVTLPTTLRGLFWVTGGGCCLQYVGPIGSTTYCNIQLCSHHLGPKGQSWVASLDIRAMGKRCGQGYMPFRPQEPCGTKRPKSPPCQAAFHHHERLEDAQSTSSGSVTFPSSVSLRATTGLPCIEFQVYFVWGVGFIGNLLRRQHQNLVPWCFDQPHMIAEVLGLLVSLLFSVPGLDWSPIDHLETFAGCKAVTTAERQVRQLKRIWLMSSTPWSSKIHSTHNWLNPQCFFCNCIPQSFKPISYKVI